MVVYDDVIMYGIIPTIEANTIMVPSDGRT